MNDYDMNSGYNKDNGTTDLFGAFDSQAQGDADLEDAQELYATMALQMEYTDSLAKKKDTRKLETVQFVEVDAQKSSEITRKLIEIYGSDSIQVRKWVEQLQKIERYRAEQQKAIKKRKRQMIIMGALSIAAIAIIVVIVIFMLNSTDYYINQGDYNHIYRKTIFGAPELYREESVSALVKDGNDLYYIRTSNGKICGLSIKSNVEKEITESTAKEFKIVGKYIYYINASDGNTLYQISTSGIGGGRLYDKACEDLNVSGSELTFKDTESGAVKALNTKTFSISER